MAIITNITNPKYVTADESMIDVVLTTSDYGVIGCTLTAKDQWKNTYLGIATANSDLYALAKDGKFGTVLPYTPPTSSQLSVPLMTAAANTCNTVISQIYNDSTHQQAAQNAANIVMAGGWVTPPTTSPAYTQFLQFAESWGYSSDTLSNFTNLVIALTLQSLSLSTALATLQTSAKAATTSDQLATALTTFETSINGIITTINAANPPIPVTIPAAISITGINA